MSTSVLNVERTEGFGDWLGWLVLRLLRGILFLLLVLALIPLPASPFVLLLLAAYGEGPGSRGGGERPFVIRVALGVALCLTLLVGMYALPLFAARVVQLPIHRVLFVFLALRLEDMLVLLFLGKVPFRYNVRNLVVRWLTTAVTALAFVLVVGATIFMLAFVTGMTRLTEASGHPGNVIIMSDGATDELFSNLSSEVRVETLASDLQKQVAKDGDDFLCSYEVYVVTNQPRPNAPPGGPQRRFVQMRGLKDPRIAAKVHEIELLEGRWFAESGVFEVVLGEGIAGVLGEDLGRGPLRPGDEFELGPFQGNRRMRVAGVMRSAGSTFNSEVWARDTVVQAEFGRTNSYTTIVARTKDVATAKLAAKALKSSQGAGGATVAALPEQEYYAKLAETGQVFRVAVLFIAVVMAIGGVLGVMNTMFAAISQRSKDIGVLRLLGYTRCQVLVSFLLESLGIALVGGLLGCALSGLFDGLQATSIISGGGGGGKSIVLQLTVDANTLAAGLLFTLVMGTVGGLVPSLSAMRLRPLESLR
jgi:ABC-type antimicrobial peptide transport system permease subunit